MLAIFVLDVSLAFAGVEGSGERINTIAKQIAQPLGGVVIVYNLWRLYSNEHNKGKNALGLAIGAGLAAWDYTVELIKWIVVG
ncbi:hypothetical protein [Persephonella sp.]